MLLAGTLALQASVDSLDRTAELDAAFADLKEKKEHPYGKRDYLKPQTRFGQHGQAKFRGRPFARNGLHK